MTLGERVRVWRNFYSWTLDELADRSGVERGTISAMEVRKSKRSEHGPALARAFGLRYEELLDSEIPPEDRLKQPLRASEPTEFPSTVLLTSGVTPDRRAPVIAWARLGEDLNKRNDHVQSDRHASTPRKASDRCKWVAIQRDYPLYRLKAGDLVCLDPDLHNHVPVENHLYLFHTPGGFILAEYRSLAGESFEAIPHEGTPLERDRHGLQLAAVVRGTWME